MAGPSLEPWRSWGLLALLVWVAVFAVRPAQADTRELAALADELARLKLESKGLTEEYLRPEVVKGQRPYSERMTDAEILYLLGDYTRASLVLMDLVQDETNERQPTYPRALYYLADSLFQIGNDASARHYFEVIVQRRDAAHVRDAVRRLIELADRAERWEGVPEKVLALKEAGGKLPPDIAYIHGRSLLRQGRVKEALVELATVPKEHRLYAKAAYVAAVGTLQEGDLAPAAERFAALAKLEGQYDDLEIIRDLATMNHGRLLFEEGKLAQAADAYQFVGKDSVHFEQALFEVTWSYVRAATACTDDAQRAVEYRKALNALEILLLSDDETPLAPEARLLLGNIQLRLGAAEDASTSFNEVVSRYAPVRDELAALAGQVKDPVAYYEEVAARSRQGTGILPPIAVRWAQGGDRVQQALALVTDLEQSDQWIRESEELVAKLMAVLDTDKRARFFPSLQNAQARRLELHNNLISVTQRLLNVERALVDDVLMDEERAELDRVRQKRVEIEPEYQRLPKNRDQYDSQLTELRGRLDALRKHAYQLRYPLLTMQSSLDAMRQWLVQNPGKLSPQNEQAFRERMDQQAREMQEFTRLQTELETEITRETGVLAVTNAAQSKDDELRERYAAALERERELLAAAAGRVIGEGRDELERINRHRELAGGLHAELVAFEARLELLVASKADELRERVRSEVELLTSQRALIDATRLEAQRVVGEVAALALVEVGQKFHDIVLRADVGIVDVAWRLKEERTHEISRRVNDQRKELQLLDAEFQDVLRDD